MFTILVAEDNADMRELFCTVLTDSGYRCLSAADGLDALNVMEKEYVDLMAADIMMPDMDGYELTKALLRRARIQSEKRVEVGSTIQVSLQANDSIITVQISDHGDGMSAETPKHIFEKFYQGDSSRKSEGNGLGLTLVRQILDLCRGTAAVESEPGKGAIFSVMLPVNQ